MDRPTLSIIIPSVRDCVTKTLESLRGQLSDDDEIIIIKEPRARPRYARNQKGYNEVFVPLDEGPRRLVVFDETPGSPAYGYKARRYGMGLATKEFIWILGDDDAALPGAVDGIRKEIIRNTYISAHFHIAIPFIFKMRRANKGDVIWREMNLDAGDNIAGEMFVFPNEPSRWGDFPPDEYAADNHFIRRTIANYGGAVCWSNTEICTWRAHS